MYKYYLRDIKYITHHSQDLKCFQAYAKKIYIYIKRLLESGP